MHLAVPIVLLLTLSVSCSLDSRNPEVPATGDGVGGSSLSSPDQGLEAGAPRRECAAGAACSDDVDASAPGATDFTPTRPVVDAAAPDAASDAGERGDERGPTCESGERRCVDNTPELCGSDDWQAQATCSGSTPLCDGATGRCGCATTADCAGTSELAECQVAACVAGACTVTADEGAACGSQERSACSDPDRCNAAGECQPNHIPEGTVVASVAGDCRSLECDDRGETVSVVDDLDVPQDPGGGCALPGCRQGEVIIAARAEGQACDDGQFCTVTDRCDGAGSCRGTGDPCPGPDGDGDCSESCNEGNDSCTSNDPRNTSCSGGQLCDGLGSCPECLTDTQCPNATPHCSPQGSCVECVANVDCLSSQLICSQSRCVEHPRVTCQRGCSNLPPAQQEGCSRQCVTDFP